MGYREYYDWCSCEPGYPLVITLHFNPKMNSHIIYLIGGIADISKLLLKYNIDSIGNVILDNTESWMNSAYITKNGVYRHCEVSLTGDFIITKTIDLK